MRGKAGRGENMAFLTAMSNSFMPAGSTRSGSRSSISPEWKTTLETYVNLMKDADLQGAGRFNGFNENLRHVPAGQVRHVDRRHGGASFVSDPKNSTVADKVGYALAPDTGLGKRGNWLWAWSLAIPAGSVKAASAEKFVSWATSKAYLELVASKEGERAARHAHLVTTTPNTRRRRPSRR
ncbi:MAG: extracellular solute-binding protein [Rhizobiaceae bacterium]